MVASADMQGWRVEMEDALSAVLRMGAAGADRGFFGVYDGHGGFRASRYLESAMVGAVREMKDPTDPAELKKVCMAVDAEFLKRETDGEREDGSTCVFSVVTPLPPKGGSSKPRYKITTANIGDSRAILIRANGKVEPLTEDHKPDNEEETKRIEAAGGTVEDSRVDRQLALSRAMGDWNYKSNPNLKPEDQKVIPVPDVTEFEAEEGDILLICCDGLFEQLTNDEVGNFVYKQLTESKFKDPAQSLMGLLDYSLERGSKDNMSAMVCCFRDGSSYHRAGGEFVPGPYHEFKHNEKFRNAYLKDAKRHGYEGQKLMSVVPKPPAGFQAPAAEPDQGNPVQNMLSRALEGQMGEDIKQRLLMAMIASRQQAMQQQQGGGGAGGADDDE